MKLKQQGETNINPFLDSITHLLCVNLEFNYAIKSRTDFSGEKEYEFCSYRAKLHDELDVLIKLFISLNPEHKAPELRPELKPVDSTEDLMRLEEKYYNMLKEIGINALEAKEFEVIAYLSDLVKDFKHYFCTLNEGNVQS